MAVTAPSLALAVVLVAAQRCWRRVSSTMRVVVVVVTGPSGSGKSTLSRKLATGSPSTWQNVVGMPAVVLSQDSYFAGSFVPYTEAVDDTMERPEHVDFIALEHALNVSVRKMWHAARQTRQEKAVGLAIVEGHILLCNESIVGLADILVILNAGCEVCLSRRINRRQRDSETNKAICQYFRTHAWPAHQLRVVPIVTRLLTKQRGGIATISVINETKGNNSKVDSNQKRKIEREKKGFMRILHRKEEGVPIVISVDATSNNPDGMCESLIKALT